eukprot:gene8161-10451_t
MSVAAFSMLGVPLMGYAMGCAASLLVDLGDPDEAKEKVNAPVTAQELAMMQKYGLDNGTGKIDFAELVLLSAVRLGALQVEFIGVIKTRFEQLVKAGGGILDYAELVKSADLNGSVGDQESSAQNAVASSGGQNDADVKASPENGEEKKPDPPDPPVEAVSSLTSLLPSAGSKVIKARRAQSSAGVLARLTPPSAALPVAVRRTQSMTVPKKTGKDTDVIKSRRAPSQITLTYA